MKKEKVFIVLSHKNSTKKGTHTGRQSDEVQWEVAESVEFVNQLKKKHISMASIVGDYTNREIVIGSRYGITDYDKFEEYVRSKYKKQMDQLDSVYKVDQIQEPVTEPSPEVFVDEYGNVREKTVFDAS